MQGKSRRWILREHTAAAHAAVDAAIGGFDDIKSYRAYLSSVATFRRPLEAMLASACWPDALGDWRPHPIGDAITADLEDLGMALPAEAGQRAESLAGDRLFGALYVLEGSTLGARLLYQRAQALGLSSDHGARHLALQGCHGENWSRFLMRLEEADPFDLEGAIAGSLAAFAHARHAFAGAL